MTRISDELREFADAEVLSAIQISDLKHMAKRIDAEMVELPKDADGVPIHVGDTVWGCISGMQMAVRQLRLTDRWTISTDTGFAPKASAVAHARHDSFERIADELEAWCDGTDVDGDACGKPRDLAVRIRKLAKKEGEQCQ